MLKKNALRRMLVAFAVFALFLGVLGSDSFIEAAPIDAPEVADPFINLDLTVGGETATTVQLLMLVTMIALIPSILMVMTAFTRIIIVLHFVRTALGTQQMPPNQVLIGLALFLTIFQMGAQFTALQEQAWQPLQANEITQEEALSRSMGIMREFMLDTVHSDHLELMVRLSDLDISATEEYRDEIPMSVIIPAFILSEITRGFMIGFLLFLPFVVIDMVVASTLMAMGMMMLPPAMISLPFKLLLFVLSDGWVMIIQYLHMSFG